MEGDPMVRSIAMSRATHNGLLSATSVVSAAYAIALLVAPRQTLSLFGLSDAGSAIWMARFLGAISLGLATFALLGLRVEDLDARRALDGGFLAAATATLGIAMWAQYLQVMNALGWLHAVVFGMMAIAYFYFVAGEDRFGEAIHGRPA